MTTEVCLLRPGHEAGVPRPWGADGCGEPPFLSRLTTLMKWESTVRLPSSPIGRMFLSGLSCFLQNEALRFQNRKAEGGKCRQAF